MVAQDETDLTRITRVTLVIVEGDNISRLVNYQRFSLINIQG